MSHERARYIAVEGPIGVGKTSLVSLLARKLKARAVFEASDENPFLGNFYADRARHALQAQLFFLLNRYNQQQGLFQQDLFQQVTISDYIFEKDRLYASLNLDRNELALYERVYALLDARVVKPDLVIFLQARNDVLLGRIKRRGRESERRFDATYLEQVSRAYNDFFHHYSGAPVLIVNTSEIDFVANEADLDQLLAAIRQMRGGLQYFNPMANRS